MRYTLGAYVTEPTAEEEDAYPTYSIVVEDGSRGEERVGKRYNILYLGTWAIARTLDLRFLARCLLRQIDSIGYHERDDAIFLEVGVADAGGTLCFIPTSLIPGLCAARRRAEKFSVHAPGGMVAALDLQSGEAVAPALHLDIPDNSVERLGEFLPMSLNGVTDRFPVEDGQRVPLGGFVTLDIGPDGIHERSRAETVLDLALTARNLERVGGQAIKALGEAVRGAACFSAMWSNTNGMLKAVVDAGQAARAVSADTPPAVSEIRPGVDEQRRSHP